MIYAYETIIAVQCDGDLEDKYRDYTLDEMLEIYEMLGE